MATYQEEPAMVDPVVSSKYGTRPLLEVPALHVDPGQARLEVSSLQERPKPDLGMAPAIIYRSEGLNQQPRQPQPPVGISPNPGVSGAQPVAVPAALPPAQAMPGNLYAAPAPNTLPYQQVNTLQPQVINVPPMRLQAPPQHYVDGSGNIIPMPAAFPAQPAMQPPTQVYPGVHNPYQGQGYYVPGGAAAPPGVVPSQYQQHHHYPQPPAHPHTPMENFRLEGVLEYGQLTTVHFRDRTNHFRGLPDFLRRELQKTYGRYPATDIRIVAQNGEFHIYATPRNEGEEFADGGYAGSDSRMIGFNEIRGDAR